MVGRAGVSLRALLVCLGETGLCSLPPVSARSSFCSFAIYLGLDSILVVLCFSGGKQVELMITGH